MDLSLTIEPIIRLLFSAILGAVIGYERELNQKPAGLRTHILVCLASCLVTIVSIFSFPDDPARLLAQIIPGIGFIGAGSIIASGERVTGLTTATGIFITAAIGIAVGVGQIILAMATTFIVGFVLYSGFIKYRGE